MKKDELEVSVVMPCLNEELSVGVCVEKAVKTLKKLKIKGEVVVSDNGSTDRSVEIAKKKGARVVHQPKKGYGNAYLKGLSEAKGKYIIMADSDDTYDFTNLERFILPLRKGYDMVMGSRLKGKIMPGAMPWLHKYIGNPFLSWFLRSLFRTNISDAHCGMRSFTKDAFKRMHLKTTGMEFASEMVINASKAKLKIKEIPITLYANNDRQPHLNSFRDGWRHLSFMMMYSPFHLFYLPGIILLFTGIFVFSMLLIFEAKILGLELGPISGILASLLSLAGMQIITLGYFSKLAYARYSPFRSDKRFKGSLGLVNDFFKTQKTIPFGIIVFLLGFFVDLFVVVKWFVADFGPLTSVDGILAAVGLTLIFMGMQLIFNTFFVGVMDSE